MATWESVVREHGQMAFDTAWRILGHVEDTEDVVQEALLDALRLYREGDVRNWGGLLRHLATRRAIDCLRRRRPSQPLAREPASPPGAQPHHVAVAHELAEQLRVALTRLPLQQATVFSLRYFGELTNQEIAATLQLKPAAVAVALHKARTTLADMLQQNETKR